jgi:hypothetical protein
MVPKAYSERLAFGRSLMGQIGVSGEWTDAEEEKLKAAWVEEPPEAERKYSEVL